MKKIALIFALLAAASAAEATTVYMGAWSKHLDNDHDYNEQHDLLAVEHDRWIAGTLVNSYNDRTYLVGRGWDLAGDENWKFRLYAGASYGYRTCDGGTGGDKAKVCPALVPELSLTRYRVQPAVMLFGGAAAISVKVEF